MRRVVIYGLAMVLQASALRVQQFNEMQSKMDAMRELLDTRKKA